MITQYNIAFTDVCSTYILDIYIYIYFCSSNLIFFQIKTMKNLRHKSPYIVINTRILLNINYDMHKHQSTVR